MGDEEFSGPFASQRHAAEYVRMSTDHQHYSIALQQDAIRQYADVNGWRIVRSYNDEARSGLTLEKRPALKELLRDVIDGEPPFEALLVYDVSRWGRFQDTDESAHYEYLCRRAGVRIIYCAEPFADEVSTLTGIMKSIRRGMAAEYSRELSSKVVAGQVRLLRMGFRQGGRAGLGFRRMLLGADGEAKGLLNVGEQKNLQSDRVVLIAGPAEEVELIRKIFALFVQDQLGEQAIADRLNAEGWQTDRGFEWQAGTVHTILTNEKYIGVNVYGRTSARLSASLRLTPESTWVRCANAHPALVDRRTFEAAQHRIDARKTRPDKLTMLNALKVIWKKHGRISSSLIDADHRAPFAYLYKSRFGSLSRAYELIGYTPTRDMRFHSERCDQKRLVAELTSQLRELLFYAPEAGNAGSVGFTVGGLKLNLVCVPARAIHRAVRWILPPFNGPRPDLLVLVRLHPHQAVVKDILAIPKFFLPEIGLRLNEDLGLLTPFIQPSLSAVTKRLQWQAILN
jgi:DNA invertase Pin-like site-specific DNA recombinase